MIEVRNLAFSYEGEKEVLKDVSLRIEEASYIAIMGDNGAGKSTLVKHFNGLLRPTRGTVLVDGLDTSEETVSSLSRKVALVFQYPESMFFSETVHDEMAFALRNFGFSDKVVEDGVRKYLTLFGLQRYEDRSPFTLSGGEQRRLALACVLTWGPKYVILDEPTAGQDQLQRELLVGIVRQLITQGKTVVVVSHDVEFVAETSPYVFLMADGELVDQGEAQPV
ncbi:MAG: energy-coupling factor ABC transporter ATP-binding protein, partial [Candidatus Geothermarchaeales archaeon]